LRLPVFLVTTWHQKVNALASESAVALARLLLGGLAMATMWRGLSRLHGPDTKILMTTGGARTCAEGILRLKGLANGLLSD
jgi:hypothetical protein